MSNFKLQIDEDLIALNFDAKDRRQVLTELGQRVLSKGYITGQFIERLLEREEEFPTGLEMVYPIALAHVGGDCVQSFLSLAITKKPVIFHSMDGSGKELPVSLVFMFGITNPIEQVEVLKRFIFAFREEENLRKLKDLQDKKAILELLKNLLGDGLEVNRAVKEGVG
ncbi:MAG TPA: PTS sugar transporter subunit IIA [Desulfotomaculum sp.]|nr:PTS sugar transporter subunit IIA [Desulfotomaculum sp.]